MLGLTPLGIVHTAISLVAVVSRFRVLARDKEISAWSPLGRTYVVTTLLMAATGAAPTSRSSIITSRGEPSMRAFWLMSLVLPAPSFAHVKRYGSGEVAVLQPK